jgi:hypothetical protein
MTKTVQLLLACVFVAVTIVIGTMLPVIKVSGIPQETLRALDEASSVTLYSLRERAASW